MSRVLEESSPIRLSLEPLDDHVVVEPTDEERRRELIARIHD